MSLPGHEGDRAVVEAPKAHDVAPQVRAEATPGSATPGASPDQVKAHTAACEKAGTLPACTIDFGDTKSAAGSAATGGKDGATPNAAGKDGATPNTAGKDGATPNTAGKDGATPNTAGKDGATPNTAGKDGATPNAAGKDGATADAGGKDGTAPVAGGKDGGSDHAAPAKPGAPSTSTDGKPDVSSAPVEPKLNSSDQKAVDAAVGYVEKASWEKTPVAAAKDFSSAVGAAEFRKGNEPGVDAHFGARAQAVTDQLRKDGVKPDVIDAWQSNVDTVAPKPGAQSGAPAAPLDAGAPPAAEHAKDWTTPTPHADSTLPASEQSRVNAAVNDIHKALGDKNPITGAKDFSAAAKDLQTDSGNGTGTDPKFAARAAAVMTELNREAVSTDVTKEWGDMTYNFTQKPASASASLKWGAPQ